LDEPPVDDEFEAAIALHVSKALSSARPGRASIAASAGSLRPPPSGSSVSTRDMSKNRSLSFKTKSAVNLFAAGGGTTTLSFRAGSSPVVVDHPEGSLISMHIERNAAGESGFHIWPDFMTICSIDRGRQELSSMEEGDIVVAVDGMRVSCMEDYKQQAVGIVAFIITLLRCTHNDIDASADPCVQCGNQKFMHAAVFCPECGTRRPETFLPPPSRGGFA